MSTDVLLSQSTADLEERGSVLGINTIVVSPSRAVSSIAKPSDEEKRGTALIMRYMLQATARQLLPGERVAHCLRRLHGNEVGVRLTGENRAHYTGLCVCGSIWMCPLCAAKISERRRIELDKAVKAWAGEHNGNLLLITFTLKHKKYQTLAETKTIVKGAHRHLKRGKSWQLFCGKYKIAGYVSDFELTHGLNGWHPHIHMLVFLETGFNFNAFTREIKERWLKEVERLGGATSWEYGIDVRNASQSIAEYISKFGKEPKWTISHEITKSISKFGRQNGRTPMELLRDYTLVSDEKAGLLWLEYARTMKGFHQLDWSRGSLNIRKKLELGEEKTDEELATEELEHSRLLLLLTPMQWKVILAHDARAELLIVAQLDDQAKLQNYLWSLGIDVQPVVDDGDKLPADQVDE